MNSTEDHGIDRILPRSLNFAERVHGFLAKQKEGTLGQLVTEKGIDEIYSFSRAGPANFHEHRPQERDEDPQAIDNDKDPEPMIRDPVHGRRSGCVDSLRYRCNSGHFAP